MLKTVMFGNTLGILEWETIKSYERQGLEFPCLWLRNLISHNFLPKDKGDYLLNKTLD